MFNRRKIIIAFEYTSLFSFVLRLKDFFIGLIFTAISTKFLFLLVNSSNYIQLINFYFFVTFKHFSFCLMCISFFKIAQLLINLYTLVISMVNAKWLVNYYYVIFLFTHRRLDIIKI